MLPTSRGTFEVPVEAAVMCDMAFLRYQRVHLAMPLLLQIEVIEAALF